MRRINHLFVINRKRITRFYLDMKKAKIIFLGDSGVGKSSIICSMNQHPISLKHEPTIGMDFHIKILAGKNAEYKLQLWDTAGQEKFRSIMPSYLRNAQIVILVYDLTDFRTFLNLEKWISFYDEHCRPESSLIIVGNKVDLYRERCVSMEKLKEKILPKYNYLEISAKTGESLQSLFNLLIQELDAKQMFLNRCSQPIQEAEKKQRRCCGGMPLAKSIHTKIEEKTKFPPEDIIKIEKDDNEKVQSTASIQKQIQ